MALVAVPCTFGPVMRAWSAAAASAGLAPYFLMATSRYQGGSATASVMIVFSQKGRPTSQLRLFMTF